MKEMSVAEQRYKAVLAVIGDGRQVSEAAAAWGVSRPTLHAWLARYEQEGLEGLVDRSHRPHACPHQMDPAVEVAVLEVRRRHPGRVRSGRGGGAAGRAWSSCGGTWWRSGRG